MIAELASGADAPAGLWLAAILLGYGLGSIPFGLVLARIGGYGDIREIGSGNIGATNVLRTGSKPLALATLLLDSGKGGIAVLATAYLFAAHDPAVAAGVAAVLGHNFPVWLRFKGGKGVATTLGTLLTIAWPVGLAACFTWLVVAAAFRFSSAASVAALAASPAYAWFLVPAPNNVAVAYAAAVLGVLAVIRHKANIQRLLAGEESKIGKKKEQTPKDQTS